MARAWTSAALALLVAVAVVPARAQSGAAERPGTTHPTHQRVHPRPPATSRGVVGARYAIPLWGGSKHLVVRGTFNGVLSGPMLVDTGASYCVLTRAVARQLGLGAHAADSVPVATANGEVNADLVTLDSVQIDDARLAGVDAVVMDAVEPPLIGIIGLSFLNHFRYSVDHSEGTIQLER
jgi:clan AA aspartic protease (TIGR02281 family)